MEFNLEREIWIELRKEIDLLDFDDEWIRV
jgi:hypothetical protein